MQTYQLTGFWKAGPLRSYLPLMLGLVLLSGAAAVPAAEKNHAGWGSVSWDTRLPGSDAGAVVSAGRITAKRR